MQSAKIAPDFGAISRPKAPNCGEFWKILAGFGEYSCILSHKNSFFSELEIFQQPFGAGCRRGDRRAAVISRPTARAASPPRDLSLVDAPPPHPKPPYIYNKGIIYNACERRRWRMQRARGKYHPPEIGSLREGAVERSETEGV